MPFIHFSTTKKLNPSQKALLATGIAECVTLLPGKPPARTMIRIDDGCDIFRGGEVTDCAFMETIFRNPVPHESQKTYIEALYALFQRDLNLEISQVYFAMNSLETWGSRGTLH